MAKRNSDVRLMVDYDLDAMNVKFSAVSGTGKDTKVLRTLTLNWSLLDDQKEIQKRVMLYGLNKVLTDRTSGVKDKLDKLDAMNSYMALLSNGDWVKERESGGPTVRIEVEAIAEIYGITVAEAQKALRKYDPEARAKILASNKVKAKVEEIQERRAAAGAEVETDLGDLL